jgi:hypothetical protein
VNFFCADVAPFVSTATSIVPAVLAAGSVSVTEPVVVDVYVPLWTKTIVAPAAPGRSSAVATTTVTASAFRMAYRTTTRRRMSTTARSASTARPATTQLTSSGIDVPEELVEPRVSAGVPR